jgi:hypothetical protein
MLLLRANKYRLRTIAVTHLHAFMEKSFVRKFAGKSDILRVKIKDNLVTDHWETMAMSDVEDPTLSR